MRSSGGSGGSPAVLSYLNSALSARGPAALPYVEELKWTIREHVVQLLASFPSLSPSTAHFTHNDGRTAHLLRVQGTLPIYFQGVKYNIPVCFWLPEAYPRSAPLCFVTPTAEMVVKPGHACVEACGLVSAPYLQRWTFPSHTLVDAAGQLAEAFGRDPPLFSKPPSGVGAAQQSQQSPPQQQQHAISSSPPGAGLAAASSAAGAAAQQERWAGAQLQAALLQAAQQQRAPAPALAPALAPAPPGAQQYAAHSQHASQLQARPAYPSLPPHPPQPTPAPPARASPPAPPPAPPAPPPAPSGPPPESAFREKALSVLTHRSRECLAAAAAAESEAVQALIEEQNRLETRRVGLAAALQPLRLEREGLEHHVAALHAASVALDAWLAENEARVPENISADEALQPEDAWGRQALQAAAEDAAAEDALYGLAKALEAGVLSLELYLRLVRQLCREQFFARATGLVIQAARGQRGVQ